MPLRAADILQCVPYSRVVSGVTLYGDAWTWWAQAAGHYDRGHVPRKGAVLAFQPYGPMQLGHVAVVSAVLSDREVLIRHANWSTPGAIEEDVRAIDVSEEGDWSAVRVWHTPTGQMGARINPTYGFIYSEKARLNPFRGMSGVRLAKAMPLPDDAEDLPLRKAGPRLAYADVSRIGDERTLSDIIRDVKRAARLK
ncbi:CHAP domain-containing protein [Sphingobium sp. SCG-1]|uniref:CHAP domain-containing protein n=1 Tax=Sphingobium sp. SCG-1 TaxID=2072936 RepID=UPI000CD6B312|nr:CHAP domain-containing protein [Sphingobium sp. SCG-1]AUW60096.1 CHAP domain-containing protein [Sphingobium sp. SCG-1]